MKIVQKATVPTARIASAGVPRSGTSSHHHDQERRPRHLRTMKATVERSHVTRNTAMIGDLLLLILVNFRDDVGFYNSSVPSVPGTLDIVDLSEAATVGVCNTSGADNGAEEKAHDVADMESARAGRETEISPLCRFRSVVDNFVDSRGEFPGHHRVGAGFSLAQRAPLANTPKMMDSKRMSLLFWVEAPDSVKIRRHSSC